MDWETLIAAALGAVGAILGAAYLDDRRTSREAFARLRGHVRALAQLHYSNIEAGLDFQVNYRIWQMRGAPKPSTVFDEALTARARADDLGQKIAERTAVVISDLTSLEFSLPPGSYARREIPATIELLNEGIPQMEFPPKLNTEEELRNFQVDGRDSIKKYVDERYYNRLHKLVEAVISELS